MSKAFLSLPPNQDSALRRMQGQEKQEKAMQQESKSRTPGESDSYRIHTRLVVGIMTTGILCAASGGVWISGGSPFADFVSYSASIFTIFAFVATLLQLQSIKSIRREKMELVENEKRNAVVDSFSIRIKKTIKIFDAMKLAFLRKELRTTSGYCAMALESIDELASAELNIELSKLIFRKLRSCLTEIQNLRGLLRILEREGSDGDHEWDKNVLDKIAYIEGELRRIQLLIQSN